MIGTSLALRSRTMSKLLQHQRETIVDLTARHSPRPRVAQQMSHKQFAGAAKTSTSFLSPLERALARIVLPRIPSFVQTYHLTWLTLFWCVLIVACSALAARDLRWLWAVSLLIALQWVTDFFDGKIGKFRDTGLVKWGFYMDHFLDYVFLCALLIGYSLILPLVSRYHLFFVFTVFTGFMVSSFLSFGATSKFDISFYKFGPTEFRIALIIINTLLIYYGTAHMEKALPFVGGGALIGLGVLVYRTQRKIWKIDMAAKENAHRNLQ